MKKIYSAAMLALVLFTACSREREPLRQLPPEQTTARTSSTYTGTTVDFIHVETRGTPPLPRNEFDMPEFPDIAGMYDPFDAEFYNMFSDENVDFSADFPAVAEIDITSGAFPSAPYESAEMPFPDNIRMTEESTPSETSAPADELPEEVTAVVTVNALLPDYDRPEMGTVTTPAQTAADSDDIRDTFPSAETFDIRDYMPDRNDYPSFTTIDIRGYF